MLAELNRSVRIAFSDYTYQERLELIHFFRQVLADRDQTGWEQFAKRCIPERVDYRVPREQIHGHLRFATTAFVAATPLMYAAMIWSKLVGGFPNANWYDVAIFPGAASALILCFLWLATRGDFGPSARS